MLQIPIFKAYLHPVTIPGEGVLLLSEDGSKVLHGAVYEQLVPLVDGIRSSDDIVAALAGIHEAAKAYYALLMLEQKGYIAEQIPGLEPAVAGFWQGMGIDPRSAVESLQRHGVRVFGVGGIDPSPMKRELEALGVGVVVDAGESWLDLVITSDYLHEEVAAMAARARSEGRMFLPFRPTGFELWIGPVFKPDAAGCIECLRHKLERHRLVHRFAKTHGTSAAPVQPGLAVSLNAAYALAAVEVVKVLAGADSGLDGKLFSLDLRNWTSRTHALCANPHCPTCGTAPTKSMEPLLLSQKKVTFIQDGGHRTLPPEATLEKYDRFVSPVTGVVSALVKLPQSNGIVHVYLAGHNAAVKLEHLDDLKIGLRNASAGKGASETQAKARYGGAHYRRRTAFLPCYGRAGFGQRVQRSKYRCQAAWRVPLPNGEDQAKDQH